MHPRTPHNTTQYNRPGPARLHTLCTVSHCPTEMSTALEAYIEQQPASLVTEVMGRIGALGTVDMGVHAVSSARRKRTRPELV